MQTLRDIGEFGLIDRLTKTMSASGTVVVGPGDDCAVLKVGNEQILVSCDACIENVHFTRDTATAHDIGWKAASAALSDIAAMGGTPRFVAISLSAASDTRTDFIEQIYEGIAGAVAAAGAFIVGGDTTQSMTDLSIGVTVIGEIVNHRCLLRSGAKPTDLLAITGTPGYSAAGLLALQNNIHAPEFIQNHLRPTPRIKEGQWLSQRLEVHAMIDVSDGLIQDSNHLAKASRLGIDIDPSLLPASGAFEKYAVTAGLSHYNLILAGGEDYELAVAVDLGKAEQLTREFEEVFGLPLTVIGRFTEAWNGARIAGEESGNIGFEHFKN